MDEPVEEARGLVKFMLPREKPTIIYIHGFSEDVGRESVNTTVRGGAQLDLDKNQKRDLYLLWNLLEHFLYNYIAFLNRRTHNVIAADWSVISKQNYVKVSLSARTVGETLARGIEQMVKAGLPWQKLHLVGHSMGAQICGYIGRSLKFDVPRITGIIIIKTYNDILLKFWCWWIMMCLFLIALDPAGPLFQLVLDNLTNRDATFVDIIHTDMGFYGNAKETGTVDFYPNDGTRGFFFSLLLTFIYFLILFINVFCFSATWLPKNIQTLLWSKWVYLFKNNNFTFFKLGNIPTWICLYVNRLLQSSSLLAILRRVSE